MNKANRAFQFTVDQAVLDLGVKVKCFLLLNADNATSVPEFDVLRNQSLTELKKSLSEDAIQSDPILAGFRVLHKKIGKTGKRWMSSPENLKRLFLTINLPSINKIADIYNLVSLQTGLALGAHDLDRISGKVTLRLTNGSEIFWPIGAKQAEKISSGEYGYCDDDNEVICRLEIRQVEKTKVQPETKNSFFIVQGHETISDNYIDQAIEQLVQLLKIYTGGTYQAL